MKDFGKCIIDGGCNIVDLKCLHYLWDIDLIIYISISNKIRHFFPRFKKNNGDGKALITCYFSEICFSAKGQEIYFFKFSFILN